MQDRYAGDVGDFGKYGLLRWLCGPDGHGPALRLGVLWYRFEDATPGDGEHISYLEPPRAQEFRKCDPDLFERMGSIVHRERSIAAVETSGALPPGTAFFREKLVFGRRESTKSRASKRLGWLEAGLRAVEHADLVFADPDNGLQVRSVKPLHAKGPKYVYYDDLRECWDRGQSLVVYQHIARHGSAEEQIAERLTALREYLKGAEGIITVRWRRFTSRAILCNPGRASRQAAGGPLQRFSRFSVGPAFHVARIGCRPSRRHNIATPEHAHLHLLPISGSSLAGMLPATRPIQPCSRPRPPCELGVPTPETPCTTPSSSRSSPIAAWSKS